MLRYSESFVVTLDTCVAFKFVDELISTMAKWFSESDKLLLV